VFLLCILQAGDSLTIRELMEKQRARVRSSVPAERFAAALLIPGLLRERLRELDDFQLGQVLDREVCSSLSVLAPELTVCMEAADRLCRQRAGKPLRPRHSPEMKHNEGEHLLRVESALYRVRVPHLLLPFQRDRFTSNTLMVPSVAEATRCLCQARFRESPRSPVMLIDCETNRPIRLVEEATDPVPQKEKHNVSRASVCRITKESVLTPASPPCGEQLSARTDWSWISGVGTGNAWRLEVVEPILDRLERTLWKTLASGEQVFVQLRGAFTEALVCPDTRVIILKSGWMTGQLFGTDTFQCPIATLTR
jgi:hypothetical protein